MFLIKTMTSRHLVKDESKNYLNWNRRLVLWKVITNAACKNHTTLPELKRLWFFWLIFFYRKTTGKFLEPPSCGASYPGFLRTSHPDGLSSGEFVKGTVCFAQNGGCYKMQTIKIMKCQGFWIYELPRPGIKRARYCGNKGIASDEFSVGDF